LKALFVEIAAPYSLEILACEVMPDHTHLFVSTPPKFLPAALVRLLKGITARRLMQGFSHLCRVYWGKKATWWAEG